MVSPSLTVKNRHGNQRKQQQKRQRRNILVNLNYPTFFIISMLVVIFHFYVMIHNPLNCNYWISKTATMMMMTTTSTSDNNDTANSNQSVWIPHIIEDDDNKMNHHQHQQQSLLLKEYELLIHEEEDHWNMTKLHCFTNEKIRNKKECRFDDIGDFLESTAIPAIVHKPLSCIPSHRRIPHSKANDFSYILDQRNKTPEDGSMTALMDYNALLIPLYTNNNNNNNNNNKDSQTLYSEMDENVLDQLTGRYHPYFNKEEVERVKYISFTRSSNLHACKPRFKLWFGTLIRNYLGISLLDEHLNRIHGTDISINLDQWTMGNLTTTFHDFRPILTSTSSTNKNNGLHSSTAKKDQFFLFASGHLGTYVFPMDIRRVPPSSIRNSNNYPHHDIPWKTTKLRGKVVPSNSDFQYGDGIQVRFMDDPGWFSEHKEYTRGDLLFKHRGLSRGKNFHFFETTNNNNNNNNTPQMYMEIWPHGYNDAGQKDPPWNSHVVVPVNFTQSKFDPKGDLAFFFNRKLEYVKGKRVQTILEGTMRSQKGNPYSNRFFSFRNSAPKHMRPNKKFRGTSQIIDMVLEGKGPVKVGISHSVSEGHQENNITTTDRSVYLSQFYAFSPLPPFEVVAISGHFCFHHMTANDYGYADQWISQRINRTSPILISNETYRCPQITFAHSMVEMIGHGGNYVIITYGVNDCYSRSIIVSKKKIATLLLAQIPQTKQ